MLVKINGKYGARVGNIQVFTLERAVEVFQMFVARWLRAGRLFPPERKQSWINATLRKCSGSSIFTEQSPFTKGKNIMSGALTHTG